MTFLPVFLVGSLIALGIKIAEKENGKVVTWFDILIASTLGWVVFGIAFHNLLMKENK